MTHVSYEIRHSAFAFTNNISVRQLNVQYWWRWLSRKRIIMHAVEL